MDDLTKQASEFADRALVWVSSTEFYVQITAIAVSMIAAWIIAGILKGQIRVLRDEPTEGKLLGLRRSIYNSRTIVFPLLNILLLGFAADISASIIDRSALIQVGRAIAVTLLLYTLIERFIRNPLMETTAKWIGIPIAVLYVLEWLDDVTTYLDGVSIDLGNITVSAFGLTRTLFFGVILFWLGRASNETGKRVIRNQPKLDVGTREILAKLFEIAIFVLFFLILLQIMGINLTALAVFGGALGVGLGFGLQQIASNFVSGLIILLDRSISIGDFIELEDGRKGTIRELSMRSATLETYDGKDIMVPNETFITTSFTNWTHNNQKQRYPLEFQVAYGTDLDKLFDIVREVVASHPKVLSGDDLPISERPDAEIAGFGDSGIDILVEFWMEGIDDGDNRVGADLLHMIWRALRAHGMEIPFPQREVRILNPANERSAGDQDLS